MGSISIEDIFEKKIKLMKKKMVPKSNLGRNVRVGFEKDCSFERELDESIVIEISFSDLLEFQFRECKKNSGSLCKNEIIFGD